MSPLTIGTGANLHTRLHNPFAPQALQCVHCHKRYWLRRLTTVCPHCQAPTPQRRTSGSPT